MTPAYRLVSYTRGVPTPPDTPNPAFDPLNRNGGLSLVHHTKSEHPNGVPLQAQGSMVLGQYRRHSASMAAAPIRGTSFSGDMKGIKPIRSSSWAPESPKKMKACKLISEGKKGRFWNVFRRFEESKYFNPKIMRNNKKEFLSWFMLACLIIVGYKFFSDGSFSAILTLASAFQCFALALLNMKVLSQQSVAGVSQRSLLLITLCLASRLVSTLFYNGYLPVDRSGDWVYQVADVVAVILTLLLMLYARRCCQASIQQQQDKDTCIIVGPVIVAFGLSLVIHPTLNQNILADVAWTFALYVETFAMVPQLFMMGRLGGEVEALTSHYVASMAASKLFAFLFWYFSYNELSPRTGGRNLAGWAVIFSYSAQTLLFVDFFYYYVRSIKVGRKMIINF